MNGESPSASGYGGGGNAPPRPADGRPAHVPDPEPEGLTLRDYLAVIWRRKWIIALVVVVATVSAYYFSSRQTEMYSAAGMMFYKQQINISNPLTSGPSDETGIDREMATIGDLMAGPVLQERVSVSLEQEGIDAGAGFSVTAAQQGGGSAGSGAASNVVVVTGDSADPQLAAAAANASMEAFVAWDAEQWRDQIDLAIPVVEAELAKYGSAGSQLTSDYVMLRQRLQDLQILKKTSTGNYRVLRPATAPSAPYAPNPLRSAILGFGVGLFAGIGLAFLLEQFDTRVRRSEDIVAILHQPILGRIPKLSGKLLRRGPLVTVRSPEGHFAEACRVIRTNLEFMAVEGEIRSLAVTSALKGEGKSLLLANLAVSLVLAGKKVVVVDADLRRPRQHNIFGVDAGVGLSTVSTHRTKLMDALVSIEVHPSDDASDGRDVQAWGRDAGSRSRLYLLPSGPVPPNPGEIVASPRFAAVIEELKKEADIVLVDTPAMLVAGDTSVIAAAVDGLIFLTDMDEVKKPQLMTAADQLMRLPTRMLGIVVRTRGTRGSRYYSPYYYRYSATKS